MMNFDLFHDPVFIVFTISNFCTSIGFNVPYVYLAAQADVLGINKEQASYLLAVIGIANTVGRIILGYLADKPWVNRLLVYNVCLTCCGIGMYNENVILHQNCILIRIFLNHASQLLLFRCLLWTFIRWRLMREFLASQSALTLG